MAVARYTLEVDRRIKKDGENSADFIITVNLKVEFKNLHYKNKSICYKIRK